MITIYLTKNNIFTSWAIRFFTNSTVSHTAIGDIERNLVLHATSDGLHFSHKNHFFKKYTVVKHFKFLPSQEGTPTYEDTKECFLKMLELLETPFDFKALIGFIPYIILKKLKKENAKNWLGKRNALFCSEAFFIFIQSCIKKGIITEDILKGYSREEFSPEDALTLMSNNTGYFV